MNNLPIESNSIEQALEKAQVSIDQYRNDLRDAEAKIEVMQAAMNSLIKKNTVYASTCSCTNIKLICSNVIEDCKNIMKVANNPVNELL